MYENLVTAMARKGVTVDSLAKLLGVHRNTITNKLNGESEFTYAQAEMIQETMFPEYNAKYLFHRIDSVPATVL